MVSLPDPVVLVVMGVSGAGKSTVAALLAERLGWAFEEGDALHPTANVDKMAAGIPLTDDDRWPWLAKVADWIDGRLDTGQSGIITCSALKRSYRNVVNRRGSGVEFVYLAVDRDELEERVDAREGHFMPPSLLDSQLATLEPPGPAEPAVRVDAGPDARLVVDRILRDLSLSPKPLQPAVPTTKSGAPRRKTATTPKRPRGHTPVVPRPVLVLQHVPWEGPGVLADVLELRGISWQSASLLEESTARPLSEFGGLVILGGPMGALDFDRHPGLRAEAELVRTATDAGIPLLGICLGHQIIATALGAALHPGAASEVGLGTVDVVTDDRVLGNAGDSVPALHWHYDVVDLPDGATLLARTAQTPNQAFRMGDTVFSTQFHPEVDGRMLDRWLDVDEVARELPAEQQPSIRADFERAAAPMLEIAERAFNDFADAVLARG